MVDGKVYPFKFGHCYEVRDLYLKYRPEKRTWYEVDMEVKSKTEAKFTVFGMEDALYGGRGRKLYDFVTVVDKKDLKPFIENRVYKLAKEIWVQEEYKRQKAEITKIARMVRRMNDV